MLTRYILKLLVMAAILTFICCLGNAFAEHKEGDCSEHKIDSYFRYSPSRSVKSTSGKVGIIESDVEYSYEFKAFEKLPFKFSLDTQYIGIEDTIDVELPAHLIGLSSDFETTFPLLNFKETYLRLGISPSFYGDDWSFDASGFRIPSRYLLIHQPNKELTFIAGLGVYPDFENELLPILGFIYKPNAKLTFNIVPKRPQILYLVNDRLTVFAEGGGAFNSEFEVERDNLKNVVLRYKERRLGAGIKYRFNKFIQGSLSIGGVFNRTLKYRDNQSKVNIKDGLYTEFRVEARI